MMKKILLLIIVSSICFACSTNESGVTTVVPLPPTLLKGTNPSSAQVTLTWLDNSTNETGFKIDRKSSTGNYSVVGTVSADVTDYNETGLTNGTSYTYRVYAYNAGGNSPTYSNEFTITPKGVPVITTISVSSITTSSSISGGNVTDNGGSNVNSRGVIWSTNPNPTIVLPTKTSNGSGNDTFASNLTLLLSNTTYYVKAYATNSTGTGYGNEISFTTKALFTNGNSLTDICGNTYPTIILGNQQWMQKNLDVCKYRNGDAIPQVQDPIAWVKLTTGAWCYYENKTSNGTIYGKLYNRYAVDDSRGLAPTGWHIPSNTEWETLISYLGGGSVAGGKMKATGNTYWTSPNTGATNESGFSALPGGFRIGWQNIEGTFINIKKYSTWWSKPHTNSTFIIYNNSSQISLNDETYGNSGVSIRCIKD
jgi:uncharacterized protein (TIGR02145 family)